MAEVPIPFVDQEVDTSDPSGSAASVALLVVGGGLFFMAVHYAQRIANQGINTINSALGSGQGSGSEVDIV